MAVSKTKKLLAERIRKNRRRLWEWKLEHARQAPPPFYCSIDLRDSGHKIVPVDSNLYPAGFNNVCPDDQRAASPVFRAQIDTISVRTGSESPRRILILPESHTSNSFYIENLYYLSQIIENAGYEVRIGWFGPVPEGLGPSIPLLSATHKELQAHPIVIGEDGIARAGDFTPDLILLNNDFSGGYPKQLDRVAQPIVPSHTLGWHTRRKSDHFLHYNRLAGEFAQILDVDPWMIQVDTEAVDQVNFNEGAGTDRVAEIAGAMLERTREAYRARGIKQDPFVFVKNNAGTYGMGIMVVRSVEELTQMNRRTRNKMSVGKGKTIIESVVVQEGVPTATLVDRLAAEPVIYLFGGELIGGFLRTNTERNTEDNLNSSGMVFRKLCMSDLRAPDPETADPADDEDKADEPMLELVYGSIARISALATGKELAERLK